MSDTLALVPRAPAAVEHSARVVAPFSSPDAFEAAQRMAKAICSSDLVPEAYRGAEKVGNALIAFDYASRIGASPLMVMQNLHIIEGRPSPSSPFLIGTVNASGRFSPLRYRMRDLGEKSVKAEVWEGPRGQRVKRQIDMKIRDKGCVAFATDARGEECVGPEVTLEMAVMEGWYTRNGSKWRTMPDLMLQYRSASFFSRLYCPEISMGMHTREEIEDILAVSGETEVLPPEPPAPRASGRAQRPAQVTQVDTTVPPPKAASDAPPAPPKAEADPKPPVVPPPPTSKPKVVTSTGVPRRNTTTPAAPPEPPKEPSERDRIKLWMGEHAITMAEVNQALNEYQGGERDLKSVDQIEPEDAVFLLGNLDAITDAIKATRV